MEKGNRRGQSDAVSEKLDSPLKALRMEARDHEPRNVGGR